MSELEDLARVRGNHFRESYVTERFSVGMS